MVGCTQCNTLTLETRVHVLLGLPSCFQDHNLYLTLTKCFYLSKHNHHHNVNHALVTSSVNCGENK